VFVAMIDPVAVGFAATLERPMLASLSSRFDTAKTIGQAGQRPTMLL
jgi:hypothetical protein